MCGVVPSLNKKIFVQHYHNRFRCLPKILDELGYDSLFWSSQEDLTFDNEGQAVEKLCGFRRAKSMDAKKLLKAAHAMPSGTNRRTANDERIAQRYPEHDPSQIDERNVDAFDWGFGWQDDWSYRAFFKYIDDRYTWSRNATCKNTKANRDTPPCSEGRSRTLADRQSGLPPLFGFFASISHHMRFYLPVRETMRAPWVTKSDLSRNKNAATFLRSGDVSKMDESVFDTSQLSTSERFEKSIHLSDMYFGEFMRLLEERKDIYDNSIIILIGDHSYPNGEHGYHNNDFGGNEETFRVPFVIRWPEGHGKHPKEGGVQPSDCSQQTRHEGGGAGGKEHVLRCGGSETDIAPTILDMLGVRTAHHFYGTSLLVRGDSAAARGMPVDSHMYVHTSGGAGGGAESGKSQQGGVVSTALVWTRTEPDRPTILAQPYSGTYLAAVRWPFKLVYRRHTQTYHMYNVEQDPHEANNLYSKKHKTQDGGGALGVVQRTLLADLSVCIANQQLIEENRMWHLA
eukprot:GDKI01046404.1.p1 GENE.GDKI01046404.1~~GDKI01046404.1.p1  ORF type:complete len:513 (+),score=136.34 GDKI01046404.1:2-1540(+)